MAFLISLFDLRKPETATGWAGESSRKSKSLAPFVLVG
jgi:hypothetical protein